MKPLPGIRGPSLILILAFVLTPLSAASLRKQFDDLVARATVAQRAARWDEACSAWQQASAIASQSVTPHYGLAVAAAGRGRIDEAFKALQRAVATGFASVDVAGSEERFALLRTDPRWEATLAAIQKEADQAVARAQTSRPYLDPSAAPAFKSYRKLVATFEDKERALDDNTWRLSQTAKTEGRFVLNDERIAAVRRYVQEHPGAKDADDAAWDAVSHRVALLFPYFLKPLWGAAGQQVIAELDAFVTDYPTSAHRGEALIYRAFAVFHVRAAGGSDNQPWTDDDLRALDASLGVVAQTYAGTTEGGMALAWRLVIADIESVDLITPEMRLMREELARSYAGDRSVQQMLATEGRAAIVRVDGIAGFEGTSLDGTRWTPASLAGRVTLIEFWATWCVPCVLELPVLRQAWTAWHEGEFQLVGVSLDSDSRSAFEAWLVLNRVTWPQVWDGKGWDTPMARRFQVRGVPFSVLIGRDGRVANVNLRGDALRARIEQLLSASNPIPAVSPVGNP